MNSTTITVPKDSTFKLPQGRFKAIITGFKVKAVETVKGPQSNATILFEVSVPSMENYECLARKVLPLNLKASSDMRRFLSGFLGAAYFKNKSNQTIDLEKELVGRLCEVELIHAKFDEERFDFPLVDVEALHPPTPEPKAPQSKGKVTVLQ
jgi:hypothetical protein